MENHHEHKHVKKVEKWEEQHKPNKRVIFKKPEKCQNKNKKLEKGIRPAELRA